MTIKIVKYALLGVLLASCGGGGGGTGSIGGTVSLNLGSSSAPLLDAVGPRAFPALNGEFVPGELIIRFKPVVSLQSVSSLQVGNVQIQRVRAMGLPNTALYRASVGVAETTSLLQAVRQRSDVKYAQLNYIMKPLAVPNDEFFPLQWHYKAMNLPAAWDIEKGLTNPVTVAVVDTGILSGHPDFVGKILPGFDMISDIRQSNDGDGRDSNPEDAGDEPGAQSSYHGSHVAGTIAAATNNSIGVAGVSWGAKIVPVRVLGVGGGTSDDIIDGVLWAAGISVPGTSANANPAKVLNLSLGGKYTCDLAPAYQDAFDQVNAKGAIVAVAAGNSHDDASLYSPASCSGVITVGATETRNFRSYYSNYGPRIDVMAPGGDTSVGTINKVCGTNSDQFCPDGVLSTLKNDSTGKFNFFFYQGTSMATPHIAGLLALMKSKKPSLTYAEALDVLKRTAKPLTGTACTGKPSAALDKVDPSFPTLDSSDCGAGLVDAAAALQALSSAPSADYSLSLNPSSLNVAPGGSKSVTVNIARVNGFASSVSLSLVGAPAGVTGSFSPASTTGTTSTLNLNVSSSVALGTYALTVQGSGGSLNRSASLSLLVQTSSSTGSVNLGGTVILACYRIIVQNQEDCDTQKSSGVKLGVLASKTSKYRLDNLPSGNYYILGWKDVNGNTDVDDGDYLGGYEVNGDLEVVKIGSLTVDFSVDLLQGTGTWSKLGTRAAQTASSLLEAAAK